MTSELTQALKSLQGFGSLSEEVLEQLMPFTAIRTLRAGETIFCQGEPSPYCFGILSGEVVIQHVSKDRRFSAKIGVSSASDICSANRLSSKTVRVRPWPQPIPTDGW